MRDQSKANFWRGQFAFFALLFIVGWVNHGNQAFGQDDQAEKELPGTKVLAEFGVTATQPGIEAYLKSLVPDEGKAFQVASRLAANLSDSDYLVREQATNDLIALPGVTISSLKSLQAKLSSPEGKYRLKSVIAARSEHSRSQTQFAVLNFISENRLSGMAALIVDVFPYLEDDDFVQKAASLTIISTATEQEVELFSRILNASDSPVNLRSGCLGGMSRITSGEAVKFANQLVGQPGRLGLEAAKVLVENKQRNCFVALLSLLDDDNTSVKFVALNTIRGITGLGFENNYLADAKSVAKAREQTKSWLLEVGDKEIAYRWPSSVRVGRRLISHYTSDVVTELDESNRVVWTINMSKPFACRGLPNGHRMIIQYTSQHLVEYDATGKEVRRIRDLPDSPSGFCQKANGEIWVAAGQSESQIVKISREGKRVKGFKVPGTPTSVELGPNGNLICALYSSNCIVELDDEGKTVKTIKVKGDPYHAQPLSSGNYLVSFPKDGRIVEYDPDGKLVWEHDCANSSYRAQELEDGSIVFADEEGFHRISRSGAKIEFKALTHGKINYSFSY